ncbi:MAG: hypothetical protein RLY93_08885 [Sumerlaeia bacterium]
MKDPIVERRYADCAELIEAWKNYLDMFSAAVKDESGSAVTPDTEQAFMDTKARIAMLHDSFLAAVKSEKKVAQNMIELVNRSITLRHLRKMSPSDAKKVEIEWHEAYMLLDDTVTHLRDERERLENINEFNYNMKKAVNRFTAMLGRGLRSIYFKLAVVLAVILGIIFLTPESAWDWVREQKAVGEPFGAYLDFKRGIGLGGPYSTVDKFMEERLTTMPPDIQLSELNTTQQAAARPFAPLDLFGKNGETFLNEAKAYRAATLRTDNGPVRVYAFYYFREKDPRNFANNFLINQTKSPAFANYTVFTDENALIILQSPSAVARSTVQYAVFG